jgi:uncharacterized protein (TIGR00730 family)
MNPRPPKNIYPTSQQDAAAAERDGVVTPQTMSPSYRLSYTDIDFLMKEELRPVRLQLELLKPELLLQEHGIDGTVVVFGGSRIPEPKVAAEKLARLTEAAALDPENQELKRQVAVAGRVAAKSHYYDEARRLGALVSEIRDSRSDCNLIVITGGGPGIMEAANKGAQMAGAKSIGLNISLPFEQSSNPYIPPDLNIEFHYFFMRKFWFVYPCKALIAFPGGFGTMDELFEVLTLVQTQKLRKDVFIVLYGKKFWESIFNFEGLLEARVISQEDLNLFVVCDTPKEAFNHLKKKLTDRYLK